MEYAPEYTKREIVILISLQACLGLLVIVGFKYWFEPLMNAVGERPHCYEFFGLNAADYLWHFIFVGIPLSAGLMFGLLLAPIGIRGLKEGQFPPKLMKVFKPTVIRRGIVGKLKSGACLGVPLLLFAMSIWGYYQAEAMQLLDINQLHADSPCNS